MSPNWLRGSVHIAGTAWRRLWLMTTGVSKTAKLASEPAKAISDILARARLALQPFISRILKGLMANWLPVTGVTISLVTLLFGTGLLGKNSPSVPYEELGETVHDQLDPEMEPHSTEASSAAQPQLIAAAEAALAIGGEVEDIIAALELYRQSIRLGPASPRAQALHDELRLKLLAQARREIEAGNPDRARKLLDMAAAEWPGDDAFAELRDERRQLVEQLAAAMEVGRLNDLGDARLASDNLATPAGDSAADYFRRALAMDPQSERSIAGILQVTERYATLIRDALERSDIFRAKRLHSRLVDVEPQHPLVGALEERIEVAEETERTAQSQNDNLAEAIVGSATLAPPPSSTVADDEEGQLWSAVMNECDEAQLRRYIDAYPAGRHIEEAWRRLSACLEAR